MAEQAAAAPKPKKKRERKVGINGIAHVQSTFNNTIVTIADMDGHTVAWASAGKVGFKGSRKSTPFAAQIAAESATKEALSLGLKKVEVWVKGPGAGREHRTSGRPGAAGAHRCLVEVRFRRSRKRATAKSCACTAAA